MTARTHVIRAVSLILCLSPLALQSGCSSSGGGAEAPASNPAAELRLDLSTPSGFTAVVADGRSTVPIRLQVTNGLGAGLPGMAVTFATTAGTLSASPVVRASRTVPSADEIAATRQTGEGSVTVTTDANGTAQVLLTPGTTAGTALVTADVQGFRTNIIITFVSGPSSRVQLSASPTTVNAGGTATLTATVTDINGNLVSGETVAFTLTSNISGAALSAASGVTNSNGQLTVTYTAGSRPGADTVQARATSTAVVGMTSITVTLPPGAPGAPVPSRIDLLVSSPQLNSNGSETVTLTALVRDAANNVVSGVVVTFTANSGSIQVTRGTTDATGTAMALLTTGGDRMNRTITVTATAGAFNSTNTVQVTGTTLTLSGATALVLGSTTQLSILLRDWPAWACKISA